MLRPLHWLATLLGLVLITLLVQHRDGSITTEVWIDRPPIAVWPYLTDTGAYPTWNPAITRIDGNLKQGATIRVTSHNRRFGINTYRGHVITVEPFREIRWQSAHPIPGLFEGERVFRLEEAGGRTHLFQTEGFTGLLVGRLTAGLFEDTAFQLNDLDQALKHRVEAATP